VQRVRENKPRSRLERVSSSQLAACDRLLTYHIPGFLVAGQPCILAGGKKNLKTGLAVALSVALAAKVDFLGHFPVSQACRVGLFSGESGDVTLRETAQRICFAHNLALRDLENLVWCFDLPKFNSPTDLRLLREFIERDELKVAILDPVYLCLGADVEAGNMFAVGEMMSRIAEIGKLTGCTIILAHHTRKNLTNPYQPAELEDIAWAGFQEFARQWVLLSRREPYDPDSGGLHKLWVNAGGSAGHSGLWGVDVDERRDEDTGGRGWKVKIVTAAKARVEAESAIACRKRDKVALQQQATWSRNEAAILKAIEGVEAWMSQRQIKTAARMSGETARPIIVELAKKGVLEERVNQRGYPEYRLPPGTPE